MEIKEAYVSYDVAKLLYEREFYEPCDMYYKMSCKSDEPEEAMWEELNYGQERYIKAPTHQMATDWLRVRHGIFVHIVYEPEHGDKFEWYALIRKDGTIVKITDGIRDSDYHKLLDHAIRDVVKGCIAVNIE